MRTCVSVAVIYILDGGQTPDTLNHTHVALIPKMKDPKSVTDLNLLAYATSSTNSPQSHCQPPETHSS